MEPKKITVLVVDDHPLMVEGYRSILLSAYEEKMMDIRHAYSCEAAFKQLSNPAMKFDIVLLDFELPAYPAQNINSGEDLAKLIRKTAPRTKVMVLTSHTEAFLIYQLSKKVSPEGLLIKSDFNHEELLTAFEAVLKGIEYYSISARIAIKEVAKNHDFLDAYDRRIISLLAKGIKTKNLPDHLGISVSAIDKRKAKIKDFFNLAKASDEDIIDLAKKRGLI